MNTKKILEKLDEIKELIQNEKSKLKWIKIGNLEWSKCLGEMDWHKACKKCKELGGRLPTRVELLDLVDNHKKECEDFEDGYYWSSTENSGTIAWVQFFPSGSPSGSYKGHSNYVRCVRG